MVSLLFLALGAAQGAHAWGALGHETVAYIAQHYVDAHTQSWAQAILSDTSSSYLANVATWADSYRSTAAGAFSAPFHYIDAEDNPPSSCSVNYARDCGATGCSISAITNYTRRVQAPATLSAQEINYALRFLVHFIGDITQPLHDEALEVGGNDIDVRFDGDSTNLHHVWDTSMPEQLRGGSSLADAQKWATALTAAIDTGVYKSAKASWIAGLDITSAQATALGWATDANKYMCSVVLPKGQAAVETGDLYPTYYNSAIGTVELQLAKAGYRLGIYLNAIAKGQKVGKREAGGEEVVEEVDAARVDLSGRDLLPAARPLSVVRLRREAVGWGCKH